MLTGLLLRGNIKFLIWLEPALTTTKQSFYRAGAFSSPQLENERRMVRCQRRLDGDLLNFRDVFEVVAGRKKWKA